MNFLKTKENNSTQNVESTRGTFYEAPDCDIFETEDAYKILFDLPGIEKEDITVKVEKDVLSLTAESKKQPVESYDCDHEETEFTGYQRAFNMNGIVNTEKIDANYTNGTLTLTLPKKEEQKTKEIKITVN